MTFVNRLMGLCGLTAALALASGCSDYTYFNVGVFANQKGDHPVGYAEDSRGGWCTIAVYVGDEQVELRKRLTKAIPDQNPNPCSNNTILLFKDEDVEGTIAKNLGVLDYSTARKSGTVKFVVTLHNGNSDGPDLAQGWAERDVSPGKVLDLKLIMNNCQTGEKDSKGDPVYDCKVNNIK